MSIMMFNLFTAILAQCDHMLSRSFLLSKYPRVLGSDYPLSPLLPSERKLVQTRRTDYEYVAMSSNTKYDVSLHCLGN